MTSTRHFLTKLNLQHFVSNFERVGLGNLANLFQLDQKDLAVSLAIAAPADQQKILLELKAIREAFAQALIHTSGSQNNNQNSYITFNSQPKQTINSNDNLIALNGLNKTGTNFNNKNPVGVFNGVQNTSTNEHSNDLLLFTAQNYNVSNNTNGFLV
jgi:hypothetical protein